MREVIGRGAICLALVAVAASSVHAASAVRPTAIHVEVDAGEGVAAWQAEAMQTTLRRDVNSEVLWRVVAKKHALVVMSTTLLPGRLRYRIDIPSAGAHARAAEGTIPLAGKTRGGLDNAVASLLTPLVLPNGAVQRLAYTQAEIPGRVATDGTTRAASIPGAILGFAALALFMCVPLAIGFVLFCRAGRSPVAELKRLRGVRYTFVIWIVLAAVAADVAADWLPAADWPVFIPAGIAWGWFAAAFAQMAFPPFRGLERVEHHDVFWLVRAWSIVAVQRLATGALFYGPFLLAAWWLCSAIGVPPHVTFAVVVPAVGLLVRVWFHALVEVLASHLDHALIDGAADETNPWEPAVRGYFSGYMRRAGAALPDQLLRRVRFLPGKVDDVGCYGGGFTHSRIVINPQLLEFALAPYDRPHDYAEEREHKLLWDEWTSGLVIPIHKDSPVASKDDRTPRAEFDGGEMEHQPLGQAPTLAGFVEPAAIDERLEFRPAEDPTWLDWDPGEEHDGTDPNDRDFLFGALVHELGLIERRDDHMLSVTMAFSRWLRRRSDRLRTLWQRWAVRPYLLIVARYPALLADAYTALNYGRNHLVQHLAWRVWERDDQLTARAYPPELERQTEEIFDTLRAESKRRASQPAVRATAAGEDMDRRRLVWLTWFAHKRLRTRRAVLARRLSYAAVGLAVVVAVALGVKHAIDYHPTYVERMHAQQQAAQTALPQAPNKATKTDGTDHGQKPR